MDGTSANILQTSLCSLNSSDGCDPDRRPVGAYTPNQTREQITATVYYNNNVSFAELRMYMYMHHGSV